MIIAQSIRSPDREFPLVHEESFGANRRHASGELVLADPATGGATPIPTISGADRNTGGSSRKNRKPGDCKPILSDGI
jgi:hypothetical protein